MRPAHCVVGHSQDFAMGRPGRRARTSGGDEPGLSPSTLRTNLQAKVLELRESGDWLAQRAAPTGSTTRHRALSLDVVIAETPSAESFGTP